MIQSRWGVTRLLFFLLTLLTTSNGAPTNDPYRILGVSRDATSDDIRRQYRRLCLQYHPDKNVNRPERERAKCEERFKQIQAAYTMIGDSDSRRSYHTQSSFPFASSPQTQTPEYDQIFREFERYAAFRSATPVFRFSADNMFGSGPLFGSSPSLKSIYVQRVTVPLQDLYQGRANVSLQLNTHWWHRAVAAFRGGLAYALLYQATIYAVPLVRLSRLGALAFAGFVFSHHLPIPSQTTFSADIAAGYKAGTRLIFRDEQERTEAVFVLEEERHRAYRRIGNDLHTDVRITGKQAREGCILELKRLDGSRLPIKVAAGRIIQPVDEITIVGEGWPIRKTGSKGNLIIHFQVVRRRRAEGG